MKIRNGFVSNSSSSSFVIAVKGDLKKQLMRLAGYSKAAISPFNIGNLVEKVAEVFADNCEKFDISMEQGEEQIEELEYFIEDHPQIMQKVKHFGWDLYLGSVSDGDVEVEELIAVTLEIDYEDDKIIIKKDSYY